MNADAIKNSGVLWLLAGIVILAVVLQTVIFIRKGWSEALKLGVSKQQLRKTVTSSILISIVPSLPILLVFLALMPVIGTPIPWLRLSVIGSAQYESAAAAMAVEALGSELVIGGMTKEALGGALWSMTIGSCASIAFVLIFLRPISRTYDKIKGKSVEMLTLLGMCCMTGVISALNLSNGLGSGLRTTVMLLSAVFAYVLQYLAKKYKKLSLLRDFNLPLGIVFGMIVATILVGGM